MIRRVGPFPHPLPGQSAATVQYDGFATPAPGPGNITFDGTNTYLYDLEDRVCAVHGPYGMIGYQYDAEGNRIGKGSITTMSCDITANGYQPQSDYILDQGGDQVTEMAVDAIGTEVWQHTNVWADGQLIATYDTAGQHFYFNDALGTRRYQTDASGALEQTCQSLPFGDFLNCTGSNTAPTEHHFTGKERDTESGLDYFGARFYGSSMGWFMSPDWAAKAEAVPYAKLDDPQTLNLYGYVGNNPLSRADADGHVAGVDDAVEVGVAVVAFAAIATYAYYHTPSGQRSLNEASSVAAGKISGAFHSIFSKSDKPAPAAPLGATPATPKAAPATPGTQTGSIYVVPGSATASGKPYVGRHNKPNPASTRRSNDGRDRSKAVVVDTDDTSKPQEGREKEQEHIDTGGGKGNLDNKRDEIKKP